MMTQIIVVEDDNDLREYLRTFLSDQDYIVRVVENGIKALSLIEKIIPDLVILDLNLPLMNGDIVCKEIKKQYPEIQVIMLTAKDTTTDVIHGLGIGADDYIKKPFDSDELLARIKARLKQSSNNTIRFADLEYNSKTLTVKRNNDVIPLTPQELKILEYLLMNKEQVLSRDMIISRLWKTNPDIETRVVDVYIGYLRKKIDAPYDKKLIHSVRGFGYKMSDVA